MKTTTLIRINLLIFLLSLASSTSGQDGRMYVPDMGRRVQPQMEVLATEYREEYECRLVEFSVDASHIGESGRKIRATERIRAYLLVPDGASRRSKKPAVIMLHDHGARFDIGKEKLAKPIEQSDDGHGAPEYISRSSRQWIDKNFDGIYMADSLARSGYVVLVADALYWGERSHPGAQEWSRLNYSANADPEVSFARIKELKTIVYEGQRAVYDSLLHSGIIWAEKMLRDDAASVSLLKGLPYVDKKNIGAFGFSMGAHRCWLLSAFCKDVKCGVALSWITTLNGYEGNNASDLSMRIQPMRDVMDFGDIGMFLAPKPMLFLNGNADKLFPADMVQTAFYKLQKHYAEYNAAEGISTEPPFEPLQTVFFDGPHHCGKDVQQTIVEFLDSNLK